MEQKLCTCLLTAFSHSTHPRLSGSHQSGLCIYEFCFILLVF